jgi:hypothetical protein
MAKILTMSAKVLAMDFSRQLSSQNSSMPERFGRTIAESRHDGFHGHTSGHGNALKPCPENAWFFLTALRQRANPLSLAFLNPKP